MILTGFRVRKDDGTEEIVDVTVGDMGSGSQPKAPALPFPFEYSPSDNVLNIKAHVRFMVDDPQLFILNTLPGSDGGIIRFMSTSPEGKEMQAVALQGGMQEFKGQRGAKTTFGCLDISVTSDDVQGGATVGIVGGHDGIAPRIIPSEAGVWESAADVAPWLKVWSVTN